MVVRHLLLIAAALPVPAWSASAPDGCTDVVPSSQSAISPRALEAIDLVKLRDIGPVDPGGSLSPLFTLSPDGQRAAFQLRRADPETNGHCLAMVIVDLAQVRPPRIVDRGGELLLMTIDTMGKAGMATGIPMTITPRWSRDGRWIAYLKRERGRTQVWRADAEAGAASALTDANSDVVDFQILPDDAAIVYATRPGLDRARESIAKEALSGFHYDDRFAPAAGDRPFPPAPIPRRAFVLELKTGVSREATQEEAALVGATIAEDDSFTVRPPKSADRDLWISSVSLDGRAKQGALHARGRAGRTRDCRRAECEGAYSPWWMPDRRRVRYFRREGWSSASTAIYEWNPSSGAVRRLYLTEDVLADCAPTGATLVCLRESSLQPRRLERLDPESGRRTLLFDPNPEFRSLHLGTVERLHWRNDIGLEALGDLVLPVGYSKGQVYPLVVVQYDTRGFLRGGTGDEYPIQAFANRGYAVLSMRRPKPVGVVRGGRTFHEVNRLDMEEFADRRSALSAVEAGVRLAIARGVADPEKIGITGLSDGATQIVSALLHSSLFSAAAMSSCCNDTVLPMRVGPAAARMFHDIGFPRLTDDNEEFWKEISLRLNAHRIRTPILLQLAEDEYLSALESYTALREVSAPVDMFVFPGEHHVKWQPAHRLAIYRRSIDWFDYWLRGLRPVDPDRQDELRHWDSLRASMVSRGRE